MSDSLVSAMKQTTFQVAGHGWRNVSVLKEALAAIDDAHMADVYGTGEIIEGFQRKMAQYLGKPAAVFFPSGTMAQQIALRIWCDQAELPRVAYHPLCHLEIHEQNGLKMLHCIEPVLLADEDRLITLEDLRALKEPVAALLIELPQREIGGQLPAFEELQAISDYAAGQGIKRHLDGARLYETLPYYQKSAAEVSDLFDSVYISFYKGIGGVAGAVLAGGQDFIDEARIWKRRHGGDLISLYPYIVAADYYFDRRIAKMGQYYEEAQELARLFNQCEGVSTLPSVPVTNMFHVHFAAPPETVEPALIAAYRETGVGLAGYLRPRGEAGCSFEVSIGDQYETIPKDRLDKTFAVLDRELKKALR